MKSIPNSVLLFVMAIFLFAYPSISLAESGSAVQSGASASASAAENNVGFKQVTATDAAAKAALPGATAADKQAAINASAELDTAKTTQAAANTASETPSDSCSLFSNFGTCVLDAVGFFVFGLANTLLGLCGLIFNFVVVKTIFGFSTLIGNSPGLLIAWGILRDIGNILLLFGFVFIGISTVLQISNYSFKKTLPRLLIFAVLINFSLFAAEAIIDTSNIFGSILYSQANTSACPGITTGGSTQTAEDCAINYGIAGHIMQSTGLSSVYASNFKTQGTTKAVTFIGLAIFAIVGAVVFLAAAIMLTIRAVTLTFVMVSAPIGFAGMALPPFKKFASRWWKTLIEQAFFAPILLLLILISLKIVDTFSEGGSLGEALGNSNTSTVGVLFVFTIVIAFLIASLVAAKNFGAYGAASAIKNSKMLVGLAPGFIGRNTAGRAGSFAQKKYESSGLARSIRKVPLLGGLADDGITAGFDKTKKAKYGGQISFADKQKKDLERVKALKTTEQAGEEAKRKASQQKKLTEVLATTIPDGLSDEDRKKKEAEKSDAVASVLQQMSVKEIEELEVLKKSDANLNTLAKNLSPETFAALVKDGNTNVSETQKEKLKAARFDEITKGAKEISDAGSDAAKKDTAVSNLKKSLKQFSSKDLQNIPPELFQNKEVLESFSETQREELIKSGNLNPAIVRNLKALDPLENVKKTFDEKGGAEAAKLIATFKKPKKIAQLPEDMLANPFIAAQLTPEILREINRSADISKKTRDSIAFQLAGRARAGDKKLGDYLDSNDGKLWT